MGFAPAFPMWNLLLAMIVWVSSPGGQKPNRHLGCQFLLTTVKSLGREGRVVFFGGIQVSAKVLRLLRQNRRAEFLSELARARDVDFQFEPLVKFRRAFEGDSSAQREINHAEIQSQYPQFIPRLPFAGTVLVPSDDDDVRPWLDRNVPGWRGPGRYVVKARAPLRLFAVGQSGRRDYPKGSFVLIDDSLVVDSFAGPKPEPATPVEPEPTPESEREDPLVFEVSRTRRLLSRLRGSL